MKENEYGHWIYPLGDFEPDDWFGFIYRIVDNTNNKEYIGKKQFHRHLKQKVKNRKNRKHVKKPSDWKKYKSSSEHLKKAIEEKGIENFSFTIESLHENKSSLHYEEIRKQISEDVLRETLDDGERKYYNACIGNIRFLPKKDTPKEQLHKIDVDVSHLTDTEEWKILSESEKEKRLLK